MTNMVMAGLILGLGSTLSMDIWAWLIARLPGQPPVNWAPVGRWFWHLHTGKVFHKSIAEVPPVRNETALGWLCHYLVGILYCLFFVFVVGAGWLAQPTFLLAWLFGMLTIAGGWFLLQPALGIGWAAARTPNPAKVRLMNFLAHNVFAAGIYGTALLIR